MGRVTPFTKVPTGNSDIDRLQDRLAEALRVVRQSPQALVTAKGSIIAASGDGAPVEHPVGTDGLALLADSTKTAGLSYAALSLAAAVTGVLPIANGGTASSAALSGSSIMVSNGSAVVQGAAGTTTTLLHGNAAGAPTYSAVSLTADVTGTLPEAKGGTNQATYAQGDVLYASLANTLARLPKGTSGKYLQIGATIPTWATPTLASADFANQGTATTVLHGNAAGNPSFAAVDLTADVTGTLPINKGGTNSTASPTNGGVGYGTGTAHAYTGAGTSGQILLSAGAAAPVWYATPFAEYTTTAGQSIPNTTLTIVNYGTSVTDTDSAVTTGAAWKFTCPTGKGGIYMIAANCSFSAAPGTSPGLFLFKNGTRTYDFWNPVYSAAPGAGSVCAGATFLTLAAGDTVNVQTFQNSGGAVTLGTSANGNRITIKQVA